MTPSDNDNLQRIVVKTTVDFGSNLTTSHQHVDELTLCAAHENAWSEASLILSKYNLFHNNAEIAICCNFDNIKGFLRDYAVAQEKAATLFANGFNDVKNENDFNKIIELFRPLNEKKINAELTLAIPNLNDERKLTAYGESISEYFLYDLFLILNIASPASFQGYGSFVKRLRQNDFVSRLNISNHLFEMALLQNEDGVWPSVYHLPLERVICWLKAIKPNIMMVAKSRMEKVLFALMQICSANTNPEAIIWLFYAFESLFDTKIGENFNSIVGRIALLLNAGPKELKVLKKEMRSLYDLRSAFVHGGLEIAHPMEEDFLDKTVEPNRVRLMNAIEYGFLLLLASLQKLVSEQIVEPNFREIIVDQHRL